MDFEIYYVAPVVQEGNEYFVRVCYIGDFYSDIYKIQHEKSSSYTKASFEKVEGCNQQEIVFLYLYYRVSKIDINILQKLIYTVMEHINKHNLCVEQAFEDLTMLMKLIKLLRIIRTQSCIIFILLIYYKNYYVNILNFTIILIDSYYL